MACLKVPKKENVERSNGVNQHRDTTDIGITDFLRNFLQNETGERDADMKSKVSKRRKAMPAESPVVLLLELIVFANICVCLTLLVFFQGILKLLVSLWTKARGKWKRIFLFAGLC